ncbi:helix-turn-helix domain-containing protein [Mycobacterium sp. SMC-8]|nr:helix-turn-helix domain-containing protein [Mycobacterium sp. SMC-8]
MAEYLNTTLNQLSRLRFEGHGPRYVKLGRSVRYRWEDVYAWVDENVQSVGGAK